MVLLPLAVCLLLCIFQVEAQIWCQVYGGTCRSTCSRYYSDAGLCPSGYRCCVGGSVCEDKFKGVCMNQWAPCTNGKKYSHSNTYGRLCDDTSQMCCIASTVVEPATTAAPVTSKPGVVVTGPTTTFGTCGKSNYPPQTNRVVGGDNARKGSWPWQISIQLWNQHNCGGSIIAPNWIVSAGHCFLRTTNPGSYKIRVGDLYQGRADGSEKDHTVAQIIPHPQYRGSSASNEHDIALIRLNQPIQFNEYINTVCLPETTDNFDSRNCWVTGWGLTQGTGDQRHLQQFYGQIITNQQCSYSWWGKIKSGMTCFGDGTEGACQGDSGGPLVCDQNGAFTLAGVTSWGTPDCLTKGLPNVFTRVTSYVDWIKKTAGI